MSESIIFLLVVSRTTWWRALGLLGNKLEKDLRCNFQSGVGQK